MGVIAKRLLAVITSFVGASMIGHSVSALEATIGLKHDSEYSTNVGRTAVDEVEGWTHRPGIELSASHDTDRLSLRTDYEYTRRIYETGFDNDDRFTGKGQLSWNAIEGLLSFNASHVRTETSVNSLQTVSPDNRQENTNTRAGPTLTFRPRAGDLLVLTYEYGDRNAEESRTDAITHDSSANYTLALSAVNSLRLGVSVNQTQYENPAAPDLEYRQGTLTWLRTGSRIDSTITMGHSEVERSLNRGTVDGLIYDANFTYRVNGATTIELSGGRDFRDQSVNLSLGVREEELPFTTTNDLAEVFTNTRYRLSINRQLNSHSSLNVSVNVDEENFEDIARDARTEAAELRYTRRLSPKLDSSLRFRAQRQDFDDEGRESDQYLGELRISWETNPRLNMRFELGYHERDGLINQLDQEVHEWYTSVSATYQLVRVGR